MDVIMAQVGVRTCNKGMCECLGMTSKRRRGSLEEYEQETFSHGGKERTVWRRGSGPAVIVIAEMPGISPLVLGFADRLVDLGLTAVVPHLFGEPGRDPMSGGTLGAARYLAESLVPACINREFTVLALGKTSPVIDWLRALAVEEHARCGGPGVGAVGMCFTGGFALAMSTIPTVVAPVLAQPSLPFAVSKARSSSVDISDADLEVVAGRCAAGDLQVVGLRFEGDKMVPRSRFDFLRKKLGDAFIAVELPDAAANPGVMGSPHSTLTDGLLEEPGNATYEGLQKVLEHFRSNLLPDGTSPRPV